MFSEGKTSVQDTFDGFMRIADGINRVKGRRKSNLPSLWKNQSISYGTETRVPTTAGTGIARHIQKVKGHNQNLMNSPILPENRFQAETPKSLRSHTVHPQQRAKQLPPKHFTTEHSKLASAENNTSIWSTTTNTKIKVQRQSPTFIKLGGRGQTSGRNRARKLSLHKLDAGYETSRTADQKMNSTPWGVLKSPTSIVPASAQDLINNDDRTQTSNKRHLNLYLIDQTAGTGSFDNQSVTTAEQQRRRMTQDYNLDQIRHKVQFKMHNNPNFRPYKLMAHRPQITKDPLTRYIDRQTQNAVLDKNASTASKTQLEEEDDVFKSRLPYEQRVEIRSIMQEMDGAILQRKRGLGIRCDPALLLDCLDQKVQADRWKHR